MATVIDSLVVTLGLDSKSFAEGVKGSTEQLAGFTRKLATMFVAVRGIEDVVGYFKDLHAQLAQIGFTSRNLGVMGTELKKLGEVSELFGGQMDDAAASIQGLQQAVFGLRFQGQVSESLIMLQRFGVAYLDAAGHAREFRDIALDAAKAIDRQAKVAGLNAGERFQLAQSMGFTGGVASAVAQGGKGLEEALKKANVDQRSLTEQTIKGQVALEQQLIRQHEQLAAVNSTLLSKVTPAIEKLNAWMQQLINRAIPMLIAAIDKMVNFFRNPPPWLKLVEDALSALAATLGPNGTLLAAIGGLATAMVSLPLAIAGALGLLLGSIIDKLFPSGGLLDKINEKFLDYFGPQYNPNAKSTGGSGGPTGVARGTITRIPATPTAPRQARVVTDQSAGGSRAAGAAAAGGNTTTVQIDKIDVHTRATDADGVAGGLDSALKRKLLVSTSDGGLQ